jgi:hypothetical protein
MYKFYIALLAICFAAGGVYLIYLRIATPQAVSTSVSTSDWRTYDGGTWIIKYPPSLSPVNRAESHPNLPNLISFEGLKSGNFIGVHSGTLFTDDIGKMILQRDPARKDLLGTILKIQQELSGEGISVMASQKITLNNLTAAQFTYTDTSEPNNPSYNISTTFNKSDELLLITYMANFIKSDPEARQIYNAMLLSFSFK